MTAKPIGHENACQARMYVPPYDDDAFRADQHRLGKCVSATDPTQVARKGHEREMSMSDVEYEDNDWPSCDGCDNPDCADPACVRLREEMIADWLESDLNPINEEAYDEFRRFQQENEE